MCETCGPGATSNQPEELEANGRLFAAAPDLLAACKKALELTDHRGNIAFMECAADLRAAIAKAER
jgi:hypothetical protein